MRRRTHLRALALALPSVAATLFAVACGAPTSPRFDLASEPGAALARRHIVDNVVVSTGELARDFGLAVDPAPDIKEYPPGLVLSTAVGPESILVVTQAVALLPSAQEAAARFQETVQANATAAGRVEIESPGGPGTRAFARWATTGPRMEDSPAIMVVAQEGPYVIRLEVLTDQRNQSNEVAARLLRRLRERAQKA